MPEEGRKRTGAVISPERSLPPLHEGRGLHKLPWTQGYKIITRKQDNGKYAATERQEVIVRCGTCKEDFRADREWAVRHIRSYARRLQRSVNDTLPRAEYQITTEQAERLTGQTVLELLFLLERDSNA